MQRWRCTDPDCDARWVTDLEPEPCWACGGPGTRGPAVYITSQHSMLGMNMPILDVE